MRDPSIDRRRLAQLAGAALAGMSALLLVGGSPGCAASRPPGAQSPQRISREDAAAQRLNVPPATAAALLVQVVGADYPILRQIGGDSPTVVSDYVLGTVAGTGYIGDVLLAGNTLGRRQVVASVQPAADGCTVLVRVSVERKADAEWRAELQRTRFSDRPGNTPAERGDYGPAAQREVWRAAGRDTAEERRLLALLVGLARQSATSQPTTSVDQQPTSPATTTTTDDAAAGTPSP